MTPTENSEPASTPLSSLLPTLQKRLSRLEHRLHYYMSLSPATAPVSLLCSTTLTQYRQLLSVFAVLPELHSHYMTRYSLLCLLQRLAT